MGNTKYMSFDGIFTKENSDKVTEESISNICHSTFAVFKKYDKENGKIGIIGIVHSCSLIGRDFVDFILGKMDFGDVYYHDMDYTEHIIFYKNEDGKGFNYYLEESEEKEYMIRDVENKQ